MRFRVIGPGRAGRSLNLALERAGWFGVQMLGRTDPVARACDDVDLVVLAVPDDAIAAVAQAVEAGPAVLMHMAGSRTLEELLPHNNRASMHPLVALPDATTGAKRLADNCTFAVAGHPLATQVVEVLGGTAFEVADADRASYHAAAAIAGNHAVALWAQVERIAERAKLPAGAYWQLMRTSLENAVASSAAEAITGPAARGDWQTIASHLLAVGEEDSELYRALAIEAAKLANLTWPEELR